MVIFKLKLEKLMNVKFIVSFLLYLLKILLLKSQIICTIELCDEFLNMQCNCETHVVLVNYFWTMTSFFLVPFNRNKLSDKYERFDWILTALFELEDHRN